MGATRNTPSRRTRRILSAVLAGLLAVGGGTALALSSSQSALALNPLTNDILEGTPITHSPFLFQGTADPGDPVTVDSGGHGPDCNTVTDGLGNWTCNLVLTSSVDLTVITASRPDDGTAAQDSEGWEYPIALPLMIDETSADEVRTNGTTITGTGAWSGSTMVVTVNGVACPGAPGAGGTWSCTAPPLPDGSYPIIARQDVGGATSDPTVSTYVLDTVTTMPVIDSPYDSTLAPTNIQTSDTTPTMTGGAGSAEPFATVFVSAANFGPAPPAHPNGGTITPWCNGVADATGAWSCTGSPMTVGDFWQISVHAVDELGNVGPSPDDEFAIEILPPPAAPVVFNPQPGFGELSPFVANGTVDGVTTSVRIREGATDLCGVIIPGGGNWNCPGLALPPGPHTIDILAFDTYGTSTATTVSVVSWAQPTVTYPAPGDQTSASTIDITGTAPIGSDLSIRVDGSSFPNGCNLIPVTTTYSCSTGFLPLGPHTVDVDYTDPWGTASATVNRVVTIVPPLGPPAFTTPVIGYKSSNRSVLVSGVNEPEGSIYVREGLFNLCPPTPLPVGSFSCTTTPLSVGQHTITISQTDQYGTMSATAQRIVTILPTPNQPLSMKTFGFTFAVLGPDGTEIGEEGLGTGDQVTIVAQGVPPGTLVQTEIHSDPVKLGQMTIGQTGVMQLTTTVPPVPPGEHEIVLGASAPGYYPTTYTAPLQVHGLKVITEEEEPVKELGEPEDEKELGAPLDDTSATGSGPGGGSGGHGFEDPSVFGSSVESPFDAPAHAFALSPAGLVLSGSIAIAFLLLVGFPAELLESTIRSNYDRAFGWLARLRRRVGRMLAPVGRVLANPWVGSGLTILAAAFLLGFADPDFGPNGASVRLLLAMILAVLAINVGITAIVMRVARRAFDVSATLQPMPAALAIVALSVVVSRLAGISPGFLFGVVLGVVYARELKLRDEARLGILGAALTIAAGLIAWTGYGLVSAAASGPGFLNNLAIETLAAITLEALGTLVVALLPIEFLDGRTIFRWRKLAWLGIYAAALLVFLFVVVPLSDNWGVMSAPVFGWGTLFAVFAVVAIATWALFRRRPGARPSSPEAAARRPRARR